MSVSGDICCRFMGISETEDPIVSLNISSALAGRISGATPELFACIDSTPGASFYHGFGAAGADGTSWIMSSMKLLPFLRDMD